MAMAVDPAGGDELARGVDHLFGAAEIIAEGGDAAVPDGDVAAEEIAGGGDGGVAEDEVELARRPGHGSSPLYRALKRERVDAEAQRRRPGEGLAGEVLARPSPSPSLRDGSPPSPASKRGRG